MQVLGHQAEDIIYELNKVFNYNQLRHFLKKNNIFEYNPSGPDKDGNYHLTPCEGEVSDKVKNAWQKCEVPNGKGTANKPRSFFQE